MMSLPRPTVGTCGSDGVSTVVEELDISVVFTLFEPSAFLYFHSSPMYVKGGCWRLLHRFSMNFVVSIFCT